MSLLNQSDKDFIIGTVKELIETTEVIAMRWIPDESVENLYGKNDIPYIEDKKIPVVLISLPADKLEKMKADIVVNILPDQVINKQDRLFINGQMYKVVFFRPKNCHGAVNHQNVRLVKHH